MSEQPLSRGGFKFVALISLIIGLLFLVIPALYYLLNLMIDTISKPFIYINNVIGNTILDIVGNNPLFFGAFFFIATAILFGVGYSIKNDYDLEFYQLLIYLSWFIIPQIVFLSVLASAPESIMVGFSFSIYILPIPLFAVYKGLKPIINKFG